MASWLTCSRGSTIRRCSQLNSYNRKPKPLEVFKHVNLFIQLYEKVQTKMHPKNLVSS